MEQTADVVATPAGWRACLAQTALILVAAWLLQPILAPAHVEGFTASILSIALHLNSGDLPAFDPIAPFDTEFFALSRLGVNLVIALLTGPLGLDGDLAMRLVMWVGFAALVGGSMALIVKWTGVGALTAACALLLMPGVAESAFFYNDNMLSAGMAVAALAVLSAFAGKPSAALAGALFGFAILVRADAMLLAPAAALILWRQGGLRNLFGGRAFAFGFAALALISLVLAWFGLTFIDVLKVDRHAVEVWGAIPSVIPQASRTLLFAGLPGAVFIVWGVIALWLRRDWWRLAMLAGVPALVMLVSFGTVWEVRQLLPLTPFLAAAIALQLTALASRDVGRPARAVAVGLIVVCAAAPLSLGIMSDGPRWLVGRLWTPPKWALWQDASRARLAEVGAFVAALDAPSAVVVTADWNIDRYLHLTLQQQGYRVVPFPSDEAVCARSAELFRKAGRQVVHVRLHTPMLPERRALMRERFEAVALPCMAAAAGPAVLLAARGDPDLFGADPPSNALAASCADAGDRARKIAVCRLDPLALGLLRDTLRNLALTAWSDPDPYHRLTPLDLAGAEARLASVVRIAD